MRNEGMPPDVRKAAAFVFVLALVIRLAWCTFATVTPLSDAAGYHTMAKSLLATGELQHGMGRAWRTPAYPVFVAGVYAVLGENVRAVALVQSFLGALSALAVVLLASQVAGVRAARLAGVLQAVWPTAVVYTPVLVTENLATPLLLLVLLCVAGAARTRGARAVGWTLGAAALFGLLLLVRPSNSFFAPALLVLLVYETRRRRWRWALPLVFGACTLLTLAPWLIRNHRLGLGPLLSTQGGLSMWWGNNPLTCDSATGVPRFPEEQELSEAERDRFYREKVWTWIRENPGRYLALCRVRAVRFLGKEPDWYAAKFAWPTPDNDLAVRQRYEALTYGADVPAERLAYAQELENRHMRNELRLRRAVAPLMALALVWSLWRWRRFAPVTFPALSYFAGMSLTVVVERYRVVSDPLFLILLAALVSDIVLGTRSLGGGRRLRVVKGVLAVVVVAAGIYVHKARLDRGWYVLPPAEQPHSAPALPGALSTNDLPRAYDLPT